MSESPLSAGPGPDVALPASVPADLVAAWHAAGTDRQRARALLEVAYFLEDASKWQAVEIAERALHYAKRSEDRALTAKTLLSISFTLGQAARFSEAFAYLSQTITLARTMHDEGRQLLLDALSVRGTLRHSLGDEHGAQRDFLAVLARGPGADPVTLLVARLNLVTMYTEVHQPETALHHSRLASEELSTIVREHEGRGARLPHEDHYRLGVLETRVGAFLEFARLLGERRRQEAMRGALDEAEAWLEEGLNLAGAKEHVEPRMLLQVHASTLQRLRGQWPAAEAHARRAVALAETLGASVTPEAFLALARVLASRQAWREATGAALQALDIARRAGRHRVLQEVLGELSVLYEQQGHLSEALRVTREALGHAREALNILDQVDFVDAEPSAAGADRGLTLTWQQRLRLAEQQAQQDPLTGLLNRRGLDLHLHRLQGEPGTGPRRALMVALLDIDHFKSVNDRHSHAVGDAVLRTVAHLLTDTARSDTLLSRYGGEEFLLAARVGDARAAYTLLERCRAVIEAHDWAPLLAGRALTVSVGYALGQPQTFSETLLAADEQLYAAKQGGRNRVSPPVGLDQEVPVGA
ncbi:sensor domain-containing diguanylate cyclase [Deinococcus hohokamensis]|uniref:Diguanylate cyclase n=1 Tax=Deinococcus hohokamensis TaxID=309883 RepID=A0ABV9I9J9_9DEIO